MDGLFAADIPAFTNSNVPDYSYSSTSSGSPAAMGGVAAVMPSNDWWKNLSADALRTASDIIKAKTITGIAAPAGVVSSNAQNPAPGSKGLFFQNASTGGAQVSQPLSGMFSGNTGLMIAGAVVVVVLLLLARR